ncbi:hypothetical protein AB0M57_05660 [Streptomyces sp. NPDC051597]|uniref:hypothetical protein n=1 Tax=Streptomyces sp. NPDC051597 TaxID=3155049 RepID=UPI0034190D4E
MTQNHKGDEGSLSVASSSIAGSNIQIGSAGDVSITITEAGSQKPAAGDAAKEEATESISRELHARRRLLRSIPGLSDEQIDASFNIEPPLPEALKDSPTGRFTLLSGPLGSGKSDTAARWLLEQVQFSQRGTSIAWPLWINSRDVRLGLETEIVNRVGVHVLESVGVSVVVDGIDERLTNSASLVEECAIFVAKWPKSQILGTSRPDVTSSSVEIVHAEPWDEELAVTLIRKVSGVDNIHPSTWPAHVQDIIRRPLFALLMGSAKLSNTSIPHTTTALLDLCVTQALSQRTKDWETSAPILRRLAVRLINEDRPIRLIELGGEELRASLLKTHLISFEGNSIKFSLPVFEQWFAAQSLLMDEVPLSATIQDLGMFARWRYALAFAINSGSEQQASGILKALARWNAGAAGWLVKESVASSFGNHEGQAELPSWREVGNSIHEASSAWSTALGKSAPLAFPVDAGQSVEKDLTLGVAVGEDGHTISYAWERRCRIDSRVAHLSNFPKSETSIFPYSFTRISGDHNWAWDWTRRCASENLSKTFSRWIHLNCPAGGTVEKEYIWSTTCTIMGGSRISAESFESSAILSKVKKMKADLKKSVGSVENFAFDIGGNRVTRLDLALLCEYIDTRGVDRLDPLWPKSDVARPKDGCVWNFYSPERLTELVSAVYGGALKAYQEISGSLFSNFGYSLGYASIMPATLTGKVFISSEQRLHPVLAYRFLPNPNVDLAHSSVDVTLAEDSDELPRWGDSGHRKQLDRYFLDNPDRSAFPTYSWHQTAFDVWGTRPATKIALTWLWSDLSALGWLPRSRPHDVLNSRH